MISSPSNKLAVAISTAALSVSLVGNVAVYRVGKRQNDNTASAATTNCRENNKLKVPIIASLNRQKTTLPTLDYYKQHPGELKIQLAEIKRNLRSFHLRDCSTILD